MSDGRPESLRHRTRANETFLTRVEVGRKIRKATDELRSAKHVNYQTKEIIQSAKLFILRPDICTMSGTVSQDRT